MKWAVKEDGSSALWLEMGNACDPTWFHYRHSGCETRDEAGARRMAKRFGGRVVRILSHDEACRKRAAVALYALARDMDSGNGRDMWGEALVEEVKRRARELAPWVKR